MIIILTINIPEGVPEPDEDIRIRKSDLYDECPTCLSKIYFMTNLAPIEKKQIANTIIELGFEKELHWTKVGAIGECKCRGIFHYRWDDRKDNENLSRLI